MQITLLKAKLHRAAVTHAELDYEGSCAIDGQIMDAAGIHEYEQLHIFNIDNGERFITYAIRADDASRVISINGAAAHKARPGDRVIIVAYATMSEEERAGFQPTLLYFDDQNRITRTAHSTPVQAA